MVILLMVFVITNDILKQASIWRGSRRLATGGVDASEVSCPKSNVQVQSHYEFRVQS